MEVELKEKGRVTIPAAIRKALALKKGDRLQVELSEGQIRLRPKQVVTAQELRGIAKIKRVNLEEIEMALGGE